MANTFSLLEAQTLSSNQSTVTLGAGGTIPSTYTDLRVIITARTDRAANNDFIKGYFNTDTTDANYVGALAWGGGSGGGNYATFAGAGAPRYLGDCTANSAPTYMFSNNEIYIPNYTSSVAKAYYGDAVTNNSAS